MGTGLEVRGTCGSAGDVAGMHGDLKSHGRPAGLSRVNGVRRSNANS